jgi:hypothetical protein
MPRNTVLMIIVRAPCIRNRGVAAVLIRGLNTSPAVAVMRPHSSARAALAIVPRDALPPRWIYWFMRAILMWVHIAGRAYVARGAGARAGRYVRYGAMRCRTVATLP